MRSDRGLVPVEVMVHEGSLVASVVQTRRRTMSRHKVTMRDESCWNMFPTDLGEMTNILLKVVRHKWCIYTGELHPRRDVGFYG